MGVTISKGSDKVDLAALNLTSLTGADGAKLLLEEKGLTAGAQRGVQRQACTKGTGDPLSARRRRRWATAWSLFVSQGPQNRGGPGAPSGGDSPRRRRLAMLAAVGLQPGEVTSGSPATRCHPRAGDHPVRDGRHDPAQGLPDQFCGEQRS